MKSGIKRVVCIMACLILAACSTPAQDTPAQLQYYVDNYGDVYAAQLLRAQYEAGDIQADDYAGDYVAVGDSFDAAEISDYAQLAAMMNGRLEALSCEDYAIGIAILMEALQNNSVCISFFDDQQTRDRFEETLGLIDTWLTQPDENNTVRMENALTQRDITDGEIVYLYYYIFNGMNAINGNIQRGRTNVYVSSNTSTSALLRKKTA